MLRLAIAATLLAATATSSFKTTSTEIAKRSSFENIPKDYSEKEEREWKENRSGDEEALYAYQESTADELAAAVGHRDVGYRDTGSVANEQPRQSIGDGWRDAVPGTPGMDYPNLDRIPVTSFTCVDKEPGGYYADAETGCQVFHVCNTGGVKSSFLCPPGSIFNQRHFVCDWWYGFNCDEAVNLYFEKSEENVEISSNATLVNNNTALDENIEAREGFDRRIGEYAEDAGIRNENPTNYLYSVDGGRENLDYLSRRNNRINQVTSSYEPNNVVSVESRNPEKQHERKTNNENTPRGFSRISDESLKRRKLDRTTNTHDLTNDLASYVNSAYFEVGSINNNNNDNNSNDGEKYPPHHSYDEVETKTSSTNGTSFVDKYVYGKRTSSRYSFNDDPYENSDGVEEDE